MYHSLCLVAFLQGPPLLSDFRFSPLPEGPASSSDVIVQDAFFLLCARCSPKKYQKTFEFYLPGNLSIYVFSGKNTFTVHVLEMITVIKSYLILFEITGQRALFHCISRVHNKFL